MTRVSLIFALCCFGANAQVIEWVKQFGTDRPDTAYAVAATGSAVYTVGSVANPGVFPGATAAGRLDAFVTKHDLDGNIVWSRQFGTSLDDEALGVAADGTGVYVAGYTAGDLQGTNGGGTDVFVRKYDPNGNELWTKQFGGAGGADSATSACMDGAVLYVAGYVTGALPGQTSTSTANRDAFVRRYDSNGNEVWTRQFGTVDIETAYGVAAHSSGIYVAGETNGALATQVGGSDYFVRKYDASGTVVWTRQFGSNTTDGGGYGGGVAVNSSGVYVAGLTSGTLPGQTKLGSTWDGFLQKLDLNGNLVWARQIGSETGDAAYGVAVAQQWVYVAGQVGSGLSVWRFDLNGNEQGNLQRGTFVTSGYGVAADGAGAYVAGEVGAMNAFDTPLIGDKDDFVLKVPHPPLLSGISDAFNGQPGSAQSTWTALYGTNLARPVLTWDGAISGTQLPTSLDGVSVSINGKPATIYFVSPGQVNVLAPLDDQTGNVQVTLTNKYGTSPSLTIPKPETLPAFYAPFPEGNRLLVTAVALDGTLLGKPGVDPRVARGVRPGEVVQFFATGFGKTNPAAPSDSLFMGAPAVITPPKVTIGGKDASLLGTGNLVSPGLYQFNLTIPDVADGDQQIIAEVGSIKSASNVYLTVKR